MEGRKSYTYSRSSYLYKSTCFISEILTEEELNEREKEKEILKTVRDYPLFVNIRKKANWYYIIDSMDWNLFIETGHQVWRWASNQFHYLDKSYYILWELVSSNYTRAHWSWRSIYILKICAMYWMSAEIIAHILLRSARSIKEKAKDLWFDIPLFEWFNPRSDWIVKYHEKMKEMHEKGYRFQRTKDPAFPVKNPRPIPLRWTERVLYKDLWYFYRWDYNNPYSNNN